MVILVLDKHHHQGSYEEGDPSQYKGIDGFASEEVTGEEAENARGQNLGNDDEEVENPHESAHFMGGQGAGEYGVGHGEDAGPGQSDPYHGKK